MHASGFQISNEPRSYDISADELISLCFCVAVVGLNVQPHSPQMPVTIALNHIALPTMVRSPPNFLIFNLPCSNWLLIHSKQSPRLPAILKAPSCQPMRY